MEDIKIKRAKIENLKDIQKLNLLLFEKEYKEFDKSMNLNWTLGDEGIKYFKKKLNNPDSCAFIALIDDKIVGYLIGGETEGEDYRKLPKLAELENMFILEKYQRLGIGTKLYNEFVKWCRKRGIKMTRVEATAKNRKGISFYEKNKFKKITLILESEI